MMTNTNYANEMVNLTVGINQTMDEFMDYCMKQFDVKDIFSLDAETLGLIQKSMELMKMVKDYQLTTAKLMQQFDNQLNDIDRKLDLLLSK